MTSKSASPRRSRSMSDPSVLEAERIFSVPPWKMLGKVDSRGRVRLFLGKKHPLAQKSGQQWRARLVATLFLGRLLAENEHVHHLDGDSQNDHPSNLQVVLAEYHGSYHCALSPVTKIVGERLVEMRKLGEEVQGFRAGAVLSTHPVTKTGEAISK